MLNPAELKKGFKPTLAMQKDAILSGPKLENGEAQGGDEKAKAQPAKPAEGQPQPAAPGGGEQGR